MPSLDCYMKKIEHIKRQGQRIAQRTTSTAKQYIEDLLVDGATTTGGAK